MTAYSDSQTGYSEPGVGYGGSTQTLPPPSSGVLPAYFRGPTHYLTSPVLAEYRHPGNLYSRHMKARAAGTTVFVYAADSPVYPGEAFPKYPNGPMSPNKWSYARSTYWGNSSWQPIQHPDDIAASEAAGYEVFDGVPPAGDPPIPPYPGDVT